MTCLHSLPINVVLIPCCLSSSRSLSVPAAVETVVVEEVVVVVESVLSPEQTIAYYSYENIFGFGEFKVEGQKRTYQLQLFQWEKFLQHFLHLFVAEWYTNQHLEVD